MRKGTTKKAKKPGALPNRGRTGLPFPSATFESVLPLSKAIWDHAGASHEIKRVTLLVDILQKAAESGPSRMLVKDSGRYGLTAGSEKSDSLKLTERAVLLFDSSTPAPVRLQTKIELAIKSVPAFSHLYEVFQGGNVPAPAVMVDSLGQAGVPEHDRQRCVDLFIGNAKYIGIIVLRAGAEYLARPLEIGSADEKLFGELPGPGSRQSSGTTDFDHVCFVIAPIGREGSPERKHSDMSLALVDRALEPLKMEVIRADKITSPGMISKQIVEYVHRSKLVIADLSFGNENVYYELALRHLMGLPIVHIIRKRDQLPFDVQNFRTVVIDDEDMYDLIAKLDSYRADIANHAREALDAGESTDNPILSFYPALRVVRPS